MGKAKLLRYAAFTTDPAGGNPAGVWIGDTLPPGKEMQAIAGEVGYSETAFIAPAKGLNRTVRYFSPEIEVPFCGHATIASGIALGNMEGPGDYLFSTPAGEIPVAVTKRDGQLRAALTSVEPETAGASEELIGKICEILGWDLPDLDPAIPPGRAFAGAWHLVLAVNRQERLNRLAYDFETLRSLMERKRLTTLQLVWQESDHLFHSRNPFPVGGVFEDPATGAAAAALGGYLREKGLVRVPAQIRIHQGEAMGRPGTLEVRIPETGGMVVSGTGVEIINGQRL